MRLLSCLVFAASALALQADPLSKSLDIDLYREVPNRNLKALAVRSDGRVLPGPTLRDLPGKIPADLLWSFASGPDANTWLIGTGPEGKIFRVNTAARPDFTAELAADLDATHVFALLPLDAKSFLAGTSPQGTLSLVRDGQVVASATLPADSVFDLARLADGSVLVATGNPGRIYRLDLAKFTAAGVVKEKLAPADLGRAGLAPFGETRDRNIRRLLVLANGRVIAGSAPKGNVYAFPASGGAPLLLLENRDAEVTDLIADGTGGSFYAALTLSGGVGESRVNRPAPAAPAKADAPPPEPIEEAAKPERFTGRSQLVFFPADALPETVVTRSNTAFYRLAWHDEAGTRWLLISGGEQGELLAYAPVERRSFNLGAATSSQINALLPSGPGQFVLLRNNAAGLSTLSFHDAGARTLETRKLDLGVPADVGQVRFGQLFGDAAVLNVSLRTSFGSDELEGWSEWRQLDRVDGGWFAPGLRGRYVQLRLSTTDRDLRVERASVFYLPQNRRPQLTDFRMIAPNLGLLPAGEPNPTSPNTTLGQLLTPPRDNKDDSKRKGGILSSPVVPAPGTQIIYWSIVDADEDNLAATFSLSPEGKDEWTDLAVNTTDSFVQFEVSHMPEGRYRTRLVVREQAPRPAAQRLSCTFETDVLTIDRTPPEIIGARAEHAPGVWRITIEGADALSLLAGAEFVLNNGARLTLEHPLDGILDSRRETFVAEFTDAKATDATAVEVIVYDQAGNAAARRVPLK